MSQETQGKYKSIIIAALVIIVVVLLFVWQCRNNSAEQPTVTIDTTYDKVRTEIVYIPIEDTIFYPKDKIRFKWDTLYLESLPDTITTTEFDIRPEIFDYYATRVYGDTMAHKYGEIIISDTISQNKLKGREVITDFNIPMVTKTITLTQPKRAMVFIGANFLGSEVDPLGGFNVNLSLKTRQDRMLEVGYTQLYGLSHYYSLGLKWKLSFRKQ